MLEKEMLEAAEALEFEKAAAIRDRIKQVKEQPELVAIGGESLPRETDPSAGGDAGRPGKRRSRKNRSR